MTTEEDADGESLFPALRRVLRQEAIHDNPDEWGGDRREAWLQLDRLEVTLILLRRSWDAVDTSSLDAAQMMARHGQRTVLEMIEKAIRLPVQERSYDSEGEAP